MTKWPIGSGICAFDWYQSHRPWMTLNCYNFKFSRNFALVHIFGRQQRLKEWRYTNIVSEGIVAHWKYFSTMYRLRWYCWAFVCDRRCSELRPIYQGCRALTFALARLSCVWWWRHCWSRVGWGRSDCRAPVAQRSSPLAAVCCGWQVSQSDRLLWTEVKWRIVWRRLYD